MVFRCVVTFADGISATSDAATLSLQDSHSFSDLEGPQIKSIEISVHEAAPGDEVTVTVCASDELGVGQVSLFFEGPNDASLNDEFVEQEDGSFAVTYSVTDQWKAGTYVGYHVRVADFLGNATVVTNSKD